MHARSSASDLPLYYTILSDHFGTQHWWPGTSQWEIIIGAILTQNTNWANVEKAIETLRYHNVLSYNAMKLLEHATLEEMIRPSGFYRVKTKRLKSFFRFIEDELHGNITVLESMPLDIARAMLLSVDGIGPETADSILLYAFGKPTFVIDTYTKRIVHRHRITDSTDYHEIQNIFTASCEKSVPVYNEFHALIVAAGKHYCKPQPRCFKCPLKSYLPFDADEGGYDAYQKRS